MSLTRTPLSPVVLRLPTEQGRQCFLVDCGFQAYRFWFVTKDDLCETLEAAVKYRGLPPSAATEVLRVVLGAKEEATGRGVKEDSPTEAQRGSAGRSCPPAACEGVPGMDWDQAVRWLLVGAALFVIGRELLFR